MKRFSILAALLGVALAGCGGDSNGEAEPSFVNTTKAVKPPDWEIASELALLSDGQSLHVGDPVGDADKLFRKPEGRATSFRDLPPGFGPGYRSLGWETEAEGFGVISWEGKGVVAVHSENGLSEGRADQIVDKYRRRYGDKFKPLLGQNNAPLEPSWVRYWFAEENRRRLMVSAVRLKDGFLNVTEAVGSAEAMDALRMSPKAAREDLALLKSKATKSAGGVKS